MGNDQSNLHAKKSSGGTRRSGGKGALMPFFRRLLVFGRWFGGHFAIGVVGMRDDLKHKKPNSLREKELI